MKSFSFLFISFLFIICGGVVANYAYVSFTASNFIYEDVTSIPYSDVGLLLGTTPQSRYGGTNEFFTYRVEAAVELFRAGKISRILISGDRHSLDGVNEPDVMRDSLVAKGVPADRIYLHGEGYSTINSIEYARKDFVYLHGMTIISQRFHIERALFLAMHMEYSPWELRAYSAQSPVSVSSLVTYFREFGARVKMMIEL